MVCLNATVVKNASVDHAVKLDGAGFIPNKQVEIWRKVEAGFQCAVDKNGSPTCNDTDFSVGDMFKVINKSKEEIKSDFNGSLSVDLVKSATTTSQQHVFYGVQTVEGSNLEATTVALKLATFTPVTGDQVNCVSVRWDPYGRVFDAVSLEPIPNVDVTLMDETGAKVPSQPGIKNPFRTREDGAFSFIVEDGTYFLEPKKTTYSFPILQTELDGLKTKQSVYTDIYRGEKIIQQGKIQHRDIPMNPQDPANATSYPPKIMNLDITAYKKSDKSYQLVYGTVSHPKSIIYAYSGVRLVGQTEADNQGKFDLVIENDSIDQNIPLDIKAKKVSLLAKGKSFLSRLVGQVMAAVETESQMVQIKPIPTFLIGFIYDKQGQIVPHSKVQIIVPEMNNRIIATVQADENGHVYIPPQLIPPVGYVVKTYDQNGQVASEFTPQEFIETNQKYYSDRKINLYDLASAETIENELTKNSGQTPLAQNFRITPAVTEVATDQAGKGNDYILAVLSLVIVGVLGGLGLVLYRMKSRSSVV